MSIHAGEKLAEARKRKHLLQDDLADLINKLNGGQQLRQQHISYWERRTEVTISTALLYAKALRMSLDEIFDINHKPKSISRQSLEIAKQIDTLPEEHKSKFSEAVINILNIINNYNIN
jgi:transcriptional regulator with XRE-family HTH domain